jgi:hypothetical protein
MAYTNIDDPSAHFQIAAYTGNATDDTAITYDGNSDMQPDWLWFKLRSASGNHVLFDSTRGTAKYVRTNNANNESTNATLLKSFDSDGFTVGTAGNTNSDGNTLVSWGWKANGGTTSSNTDGDITSTVQADTTAGFSIMTYSGTTGDVHTIGHGLGVTPDVWIVKQRSGNAEFGDWFFWHKDMAASNVVDNRMLFINSTDAPGTYTGINAVTSSTIRVKSSTTAQNGDTFVAYAFAEKQGYSKFGSYVGNGNANGPFVYTGFKPAFIMCKRTDGAGNSWDMHDSARDPFNPSGRTFYANTDGAELTGNNVDLLSNGFKQRDTSANRNGSGNTYVYMAFAENPFVTSTGIPTTAR